MVTMDHSLFVWLGIVLELIELVMVEEVEGKDCNVFHHLIAGQII